MAVRHRDGRQMFVRKSGEPYGPATRACPSVAGQALIGPPRRSRLAAGAVVDGPGVVSPASTYSAAAVTTTMRVPKVIASRVARIAASTEAQPLIAQAQGTRSGAPGPDRPA